jgi:hypothetical protein
MYRDRQKRVQSRSVFGRRQWLILSRAHEQNIDSIHCINEFTLSIGVDRRQ